MKRKRIFSGCIILALTILLLSVLAGCGSDPETPAQPDPPPVTAPDVVEPLPPEDSGDKVQHDPAPQEGNTVTVGSVEELLEAIGPHTGILLKPGYYNMSEYIEYVWEKEGESWRNHSL